MAPIYSIDRILAPIRIVEGVNDTWVFTYDATRHEHTIPEGVYYPFFGVTANAVISPAEGKGSIYEELRQDIAAAGGNALVSAQRPASYEGTPQDVPLNANAGVFIGTSDELLTAVRFSDPASTIDPRIFGYEPGRTADAPFNGAEGGILGPYCMGYSWIPSRRAINKRKDNKVEQYSVGADDAVEYSWRWRGWDTRTLSYARQYAGRVRESAAAEDVDYSDAATLVVGERNNNWQHAWEQVSRGLEFFWIHGGGELEPVLASRTYELVKLADGESRLSFESTVELTRPQGEVYTVSSEVIVIAGNYDHS